MRKLLGKEGDESYRQKESEHSSDQNFAYPVSGSFFETRKLFFAYVKLLHEHIEISSLISEMHSKARCVVDYEKS